jgi:hypothetical protein
MLKHCFIILFALFGKTAFSQLLVGRDTISVIENNYVLKMPWANGINCSNVSNIDLNFDGKKDIVAFDRPTLFSPGRFRCFINIGAAGQTKYKVDADLSYAFPECRDWAMLVDYNCDGKEDIFCSVNGGIKVYKNTSSISTGISFVLVKSILNTDYNPNGPPSVFPIYASSIGVPGIADIDGDGDIDILTFSSGGFYVEYHKNVSQESGFGCDSLIYEQESSCWGKISEQSCSVTLNENCASSSLTLNSTDPVQKDSRHSGSCLMCFDSNDDDLMDLVMGDISCNHVQYAANTGSITNALITDTTIMYPNYPNKNNTTRIKMNNFPCAYHVDCDGDGKKDLIATPNTSGSENIKSVWYYKNTSATNTVNFQFVKNNFLQDEMIEVGQNAFPVIFDYDGDGKKDLLVGNYGYYNTSNLKAQLALYKNVGTLSQPSYSLITKDFANVGALNLSHAIPTVGDIDADGDTDILIGTSSGQVHWLKHTGVTGNYTFQNNPFSFTTASAEAAPQLFDIDGDSKLDLMIGTKNGRIAYYRNIGSTTVPAFTLVSNFFGGVDVKGDINVFGIDGYAVPFFYKESTVTKLLVGNVNGQVFYYSVPALITNTCTLIDADVNNYYEGAQAAVAFEDINNDNKRDLFIGNGSGGLSFFSSKAQAIGIEENALAYLTDHINIFPNPANDHLQLKIDAVTFESGSILLFDILGKQIYSEAIISPQQTVLLNNIASGVYFAKIILSNNSQTVSITKKIIIE